MLTLLIVPVIEVTEGSVTTIAVVLLGPGVPAGPVAPAAPAGPAGPMVPLHAASNVPNSRGPSALAQLPAMCNARFAYPNDIRHSPHSAATLGVACANHR